MHAFFSQCTPCSGQSIHSGTHYRCWKSILSLFRSKRCAGVSIRSGGIFDFDTRKERLVEVNLELEDPKIWDNPEYAQALGKERSALEAVVNTIETLDTGLDDAQELLDMAVEEQDADTVEAVQSELAD